MRALLSVYDKRGIVNFARALTELGWEIISTGGTLAALESAGLPVIGVAEVTGSPEMLDGRVKRFIPPSMADFSPEETYPIISPSLKRMASRPLIYLHRISIHLRKRSLNPASLISTRSSKSISAVRRWSARQLKTLPA